MRNIKLVLEFETLDEVAEYLAGRDCSHSTNHSTDQYQGKPTTLVDGDMEKNEVPAFVPRAMEIVPAPQATPAAPSEPATASQAALRKAMKEYKERHGHPPYKALLGYFGVNAVRDIPKSEYARVIQMANDNVMVDSTPTTAAPAASSVATIAPIDHTKPVLNMATEPTAATPEDMRQALSQHKARWGLEATQALLTKFGYADPNTIPVEMYSELIQGLNNDDPTTGDNPVDLSMF